VSRLKSSSLALGTAILTWCAWYGLSWGVSKIQHNGMEPLFLATFLTSSLVIHELSHTVILKMNGIKTHILFFVIGAHTRIDQQYESKFQKLTPPTLALIFLAGVLGNIVLVIAASVIYYMGVLTEKQFYMITVFNGSFILINLIPMWNHDGAQFLKTLKTMSKRQKFRWITIYTLILCLSFTFSATVIIKLIN